jgi:hypothetical protein
MIPALFLIFYSAAFFAVAFWNLRRMKGREGRRPVGENEKLLRQPGEELRRKLTELDDRLTMELVAALGLPLMAGAMPLWIASLFPSSAPLGWLVAGAGMFAAVIFLRLSPVMQTAEKMRNYRLGLAGERLVADSLQPLAAKGYAVFHDVPCQGRTGKFNLDHVVVGGGAVAVIETKTWRKKKGEGTKTDPIIYDGAALAGPAGYRDTKSVKQLLDGADWLEKYLQKELNITVRPAMVLTMPGWWMEAKVKGPVIALNPKLLAESLPARVERTLKAEQMDLIVRRLDSLCRDVDFDKPV